MEKDMTRQLPCLLVALGEIVDFLGDLDDIDPGFNICTVLPGEAEEAADFLRALADCIGGLLPTGPITGTAEFGFFAQIQRLICLLELLADNLDRIDTNCDPFTDRARAIVEELICAIVEALAILVGILVKLVVLDSELVDFVDIFECLVCSLTREISNFEEIVKEISCLIRKLLVSNLDDIEFNNCTNCGVATKSDKKSKCKVHVTTRD